MTRLVIENNPVTHGTNRSRMNANFSELYARFFRALDYGVVADGTTNDAVALQACLDAAGAAGGGTVLMPPGTVRSNAVLAIPSYVHVLGHAEGSKIVNGATLPNKTVAGIDVNCTFAMVGVVGAKVSRMTVDHVANSTIANGIQIGEAGASSRSTDCVIDDCVLLGFDSHQYLAYVKLADRCKVTNCRILGDPSGIPAEDVAGVEVFGSLGTIVTGNNIKNCLTGIIFKSQLDVANSYIDSLIAANNNIDTCFNAITVSATAGTGNYTDKIIVANNNATNSSNAGVVLEYAASSVITNVSIAGNNIVEAANGNMRINGSATVTTARGLVIAGNVIQQTNTGTSAMALTNAYDVSVMGNTIGGTPQYGMSILGGARNTILNNSFMGSREYGIQMAVSGAVTPDSMVIKGNTFVGYGATIERPAVNVNAGNLIQIIDNYFMYGAASANAYAVDAQQGTNCSIADNKIGWTTRNPMATNGTGGRNNFDTAIWDRNVNRLSRIFPRFVGANLENTDILTEAFDTDGFIRMRNTGTPASASATGNKGTVKWDANFVYVCVATDTWKRAAISTW